MRKTKGLQTEVECHAGKDTICPIQDKTGIVEKEVLEMSCIVRECLGGPHRKCSFGNLLDRVILRRGTHH